MPRGDHRVTPDTIHTNSVTFWRLLRPIIQQAKTAQFFMNEQQSLDAQLLMQALAGDAAAFGDLYERYLDAIYHYVFYRVNGRQEVEDLTEGVFLRLAGVGQQPTA